MAWGEQVQKFSGHSPKGVVELPITAPSGRGEWSFSASAVLWLGWRTAATRCGRQGSPSARGEPLPAPWVPGGCCHPGASWGTARRSRSKPLTLCANNEVLNQANKTLQCVLSSYGKYTLLMTRRTAFELSTVSPWRAVLGGCRSPLRPPGPSLPALSFPRSPRGPGCRAGRAQARPAPPREQVCALGAGLGEGRAGHLRGGAAQALRLSPPGSLGPCAQLSGGVDPSAPASGEVSPGAPPSGGVGPGAPPFWKGRLGRVCAGAGSPCPGRRVACEPGQGPHCCGGRAQIPAPELEVGAGGQL